MGCGLFHACLAVHRFYSDPAAASRHTSGSLYCHPLSRELSDVKPYRGTIKVRFADTDANGHVFGNYFVFADEVLGEYWNELGLDVADVVGPDFLTFTVNANMDFLGESLAGDTLEVEVAAERVGNSSIVIGFTMRNIRTEETAGRGSFTYVFVDKQTRKSRPMPADFKASVWQGTPSWPERQASTYLCWNSLINGSDLRSIKPEVIP